MNTIQQQVYDWKKKFKQPVANSPQMTMDRDRLFFLETLIDEETKEMKAALLGPGIISGKDKIELSESDIIEIFDGALDSIFVIVGALVEMGLPLQEGFNEVCRSNDSKLWTWEECEHQLPFGHTKTFVESNDPKRSYLVRNQIGKAIKSPSYSKVDLKTIIENAKNGI